MKRILVLMMTVLLVCSMTACGNKVDINDTPVEDDGILTEEEIDKLFRVEYVAYGDERISYIRDTVTDVLYLRYEDASGYAGQGGLTWMPDPETGLPMTYTRYIELATQRTTNSDTTSSGDIVNLS